MLQHHGREGAHRYHPEDGGSRLRRVLVCHGVRRRCRASLPVRAGNLHAEEAERGQENDLLDQEAIQEVEETTLIRHGLSW